MKPFAISFWCLRGSATGSSCDKSSEIKSATSACGDVLWFHNVQQSATALTNIFLLCVCVSIGLTVFCWFNFALLYFSPTDTFICHCVCLHQKGMYNQDERYCCIGPSSHPLVFVCWMLQAGSIKCSDVPEQGNITVLLCL